MIGYQFKSDHTCDSTSRLEYHSTLSEAMDYCNAHSNCNCIDFLKTDQGESYTYQTLAVTSHHPHTDYDSWVKVANLK